jgi:hypothetical protein
MVRFLVLQIKLGKITIDDVPSKYRLEVEEELSKTND